jgi:hypothetical protein
MSVRLSDTSIALESDEFQVNYAGTATRNDFSATGGPLEGGGSPCEDGTRFTQLPGVSNLTGRFTGDGRNLTATEVNTYLLDSGGQVTYTWDWVANRVS